MAAFSQVEVRLREARGNPSALPRPGNHRELRRAHMQIGTTATTFGNRARGLALAGLFAIAVSGALATGAHAERNGGPVTPNQPCYIPGSDLPYVTGEKATFSMNGQPAKEHTCQKDGTWTAITAPTSWGWVFWSGGGIFAP
jgi:hypothetical protein